jgi:hypothetical protein
MRLLQKYHVIVCTNCVILCVIVIGRFTDISVKEFLDVQVRVFSVEKSLSTGLLLSLNRLIMHAVKSGIHMYRSWRQWKLIPKLAQKLSIGL